MPQAWRSLLLDGANLQNGPDAIRIVEIATGRMVDGVHYKGSVAGAGEGKPGGKRLGNGLEVDRPLCERLRQRQQPHRLHVDGFHSGSRQQLPVGGNGRIHGGVHGSQS